MIDNELKKRVSYCYQCGTCSGCCPVSYSQEFSPRAIIYDLLNNPYPVEILKKNNLLACLTCNYCLQRCPQNVNFGEFIRQARTNMYEDGFRVEETHDCYVSTTSSIVSRSNIIPKFPKDYIPSNIEVAEQGELAYFPGILAILGAYFDDIGMNFSNIARSSLLIIDKLSDMPIVILDKAKPSGHDVLWQGDYETFKKLAEYNFNLIKSKGIKTVITSCAEDYRTLALDYKELFGELPFKVKHITQYIVEELEKGNQNLQFTNKMDLKVTYHDPCRLGRHMGEYDAPRKILKALEEKVGIKFFEMERIRENALCCGVSAFNYCNDFSKAIRVDRLKEAQSVADILVTTCSKCQIHFNCTLSEKRSTGSETRFNLQVMDIVKLIAEAMGLLS
ncbi:MAG: (Fe-S)-binding protein [Candidatus Lokiarchaeota archaeon]|nr:(Fe-S)-binding protein [Candidatus Lokiarchaeota archaeon]